MDVCCDITFRIAFLPGKTVYGVTVAEMKRLEEADLDRPVFTFAAAVGHCAAAYLKATDQLPATKTLQVKVPDSKVIELQQIAAGLM